MKLSLFLHVLLLPGWITASGPLFNIISRLSNIIPLPWTCEPRVAAAGQFNIVHCGGLEASLTKGGPQPVLSRGQITKRDDNDGDGDDEDEDDNDDDDDDILTVSNSQRPTTFIREPTRTRITAPSKTNDISTNTRLTEAPTRRLTTSMRTSKLSTSIVSSATTLTTSAISSSSFLSVTATATRAPDSSKNGSIGKDGIAAGAVFGGFVSIALVFLAFVYYKRWKTTRDRQGDQKLNRRLSPYPATSMTDKDDSQGQLGGPVEYTRGGGLLAFGGNDHPYQPLSGNQQEDLYTHDMEMENRNHAPFTHQDTAYRQSFDYPGAGQSHLAQQESLNNLKHATSVTGINRRQNQHDPNAPHGLGDQDALYSNSVELEGDPAGLIEPPQESLHVRSAGPLQEPAPTKNSNYGNHRVSRNYLQNTNDPY